METRKDITGPKDTGLENEAPVLFGMDRADGFRVPPDYFESLPGQIQSRISPAPRTISHPTRILISRLGWLTTALVILLGIPTIMYLAKQPEPAATPANNASPAAAAVVDYSDYVDESSIVEYLVSSKDSTAFELAGNDLPPIRIGDAEFSRDEIVNYLVDNDHDDQLLREEMIISK